MAWYEGTNQYWFERNHTVPKISTSLANELRKQSGLDYWRNGNPVARGYKTPWSWLRVWLYGHVPECLWCEHAANAKPIQQADIDKMYDQYLKDTKKSKKAADYYIKHED